MILKKLVLYIVIYSKSNNKKVMMGSETDAIIEEFFDSF